MAFHLGLRCLTMSHLWDARLKCVKLVGAGLNLICCLFIRGLTGGFILLWDFSGVVSHPMGLRVSQYFVPVESSSLTYHRPYS